MSGYPLLKQLLTTGEADRCFATNLLRLGFTSLSQQAFQEVINCILEGWKEDYLEGNPEVLVDPETYPEVPMGVHGVSAPTLPYRTCWVLGKQVYLFEHHIQELVG